MNSPVPPWCHDQPLRGLQWQIAWALKRVRLLANGTEKELQTKLKNELVWGKRAGKTDCWVYVTKDYSEEQVDNARAELEQIKTRGYHPSWTRLPKGYAKYAGYPLEATSEVPLARVLFHIGMLDKPTEPSLHGALKQRGEGLFGKHDAASYSLYFHDKCESAAVKKARRLLKKELSSPTQPDSASL